MSRQDYFAQGLAAYRAGEGWISAAPYRDGWRKTAWQDGWWAGRNESLKNRNAP
jgi:hypothetical protein